MKHILIYTLFSLILLSSCAPEIEEQKMMYEEEVYMNISTRSLDPSMTQVRIIVTNTSSGQVLINKYPAQPESSGEYKLPVQTGLLNFYVVLNEPSSLTPELSAIKLNSDLPSLLLNRTELPVFEAIGNSTVQTNLPAFGWTKALIRASSGTIKYGEASIDGGSTWTKSLHIRLERVATKISLALRKKTTVDSDKVTIKKITAVNVPQYEYLLPKVYESQEFDLPLVYNTPLELTNNADSYTKAFTDCIMPEYIPADPTDENMALCLKIEADYNQKSVIYHIPVRENINLKNYSLKRNNHYLIRATIATEGEVLHIPEIKYQVADWSDTSIESEFIEENAITFSQRWETGTPVNGTEVRIENNGQVDFYFTLSHPKGGSWAATLTNTIDFMFDDTDGAVSGGSTREGYEYKIRIKPRREIQFKEAKTEFYITVNNGNGNTELNLPNQSVGTTSRYTIIQKPN